MTNNPNWAIDSGDTFLSLLEVLAREDLEALPETARGLLEAIAKEDPAGLKKAYEAYGPSWKQRGGVGAFMMLARKFDRMQIRVEQRMWDIFTAIFEDNRSEGVIDDVRDLRRYLMLIEAEVRARGFSRVHRDNQQAAFTSVDFPGKITYGTKGGPGFNSVVTRNSTRKGGDVKMAKKKGSKKGTKPCKSK